MPQRGGGTLSPNGMNEEISGASFSWSECRLCVFVLSCLSLHHDTVLERLWLPLWDVLVLAGVTYNQPHLSILSVCWRNDPAAILKSQISPARSLCRLNLRIMRCKGHHWGISVVSKSFTGQQAHNATAIELQCQSNPLPMMLMINSWQVSIKNSFCRHLRAGERSKPLCFILSSSANTCQSCDLMKTEETLE